MVRRQHRGHLLTASSVTRCRSVRAGFKGFAAAANVNTDVIEATNAGEWAL